MNLNYELVDTVCFVCRRQYAESWQKMQELRAQIQVKPGFSNESIRSKDPNTVDLFRLFWSDPVFEEIRLDPVPVFGFGSPGILVRSDSSS